MQIYRQGDVMLVKVEKIEKSPYFEVREVKPEAQGIVLAYGEVTGHAHAVREVSKAKLWDAGAERFLQVMEKTALEHEEHAPIALDPGLYKVVHQREYDPEQERRVAD